MSEEDLFEYALKRVSVEAFDALLTCGVRNHHTVIHKANPTFNRQTLKLSYPNGYHESLKLDKHFKLRSA